MTYPNQPVDQPLPAARKKSKRTVLAIVLAAVAVVLVLCVGGAVIAGLSSLGEETTTAGGGKPLATDAAEPAAKKPAPPAAVRPKVTDFTIGVKVLEKDCFGSAGCLVTFRIDPAYMGPVLPAGKTFEVVYEIRGGEEPQINRFTMTGDMATYDQDEFIDTPSSKSELTAVVTEINEL